MKVALFTAGTIGAGHIMRGMAVYNGLLRAGFTGEFKMFGPPFHLPEKLVPSFYNVAPTYPEKIADPKLAAECEIALALLEFQPDLLIVDEFWAPMTHIIPLLKCEAWLITNWVPAIWFKGPPEIPFNRSLYKRVIAIEPLEHIPATETIDPIVVCNPDECRPPDALRELLRAPENKPLTVVIQAGKPGEAAQLMELTDSENEFVYSLNAFINPELFPAAQWLGGADRIICGAGYNSFWEARWLGYYDVAEFVPFDRPIDNQKWRLFNCADSPMEENGADVLARIILK